MLFVVKHTVKHCIIVHFCKSKHVFIPVTKILARWLHQKLNVVQLQEKQHVHEKEMQRQNLQQEKKLQQDVDVLHQQKDLQEEELLADELQEELLRDLPHEEGDVNLLSFFYSNLAESFPRMCCCSQNTTYMIYLIITNNM